ncbi:zinc finger protein OZF-like [Anopheles cruzii]|uniref:zinc finger protein OZF-like n=1 Tax=Anopheles cruzii TaxID=68878 RepID=UPI0022EC4B9C|nr:zinc finger protein OZF-like [Anopheles cruzii]
MHNLSHKCRLCLEAIADKEGLPITDEALQEKMRLLLDFEIMPEASWLPNNACGNCAGIIDNFIDFRQKVRTNQDYLYSLKEEESPKGIFESNGLLPPISVSVASRCFEIVYMPLLKHEEEATLTSPTFAEILLPGEDEIKIEVQSDSNELPNSSIVQSDDAVPNSPMENQERKTGKAKRGHRAQQCSSSSLPDVESNKRKRHFPVQDEQRLKDFYQLVCEICKTISDSFSGLLAHYRKEHNTEGYVRCCDAKFKSKTMALEHVDGHLGTIRCDICNKTFLYANSLKLHNLDLHSGPEAKPFKCDKCQRSFARPFLLKAHLKSHVQEPCPTCGKMLGNRRALTTHIERVHGNIPNLICDICGKVAATKTTMERHMNVHMGRESVKRVQCIHCLKWYKGKYVLEKHVQHAHLEQGETFQCDICQKSYPNSRALMLHKATHDEPKYECEICGRRFRRRQLFRKHMIIHTDKSD